MATSFRNIWGINEVSYDEIPTLQSFVSTFDFNFASAADSVNLFQNKFLGFGSVVPKAGDIPELNIDPAVRAAADLADQELGYLRGIPDLGFGGLDDDFADDVLAGMVLDIEELELDPDDIFDDVDWDAFPRGYGEPDPPESLSFFEDAFGLFNFGQIEIGDNGGDVIQLRAQFNRVFNQPDEPTALGPFIITFENTSTLVRYVAFSGVPNQGNVCYTTQDRSRLYFCAPPMPIGRYKVNIQLQSGVGFWDNIWIDNAVNVIQRIRNDATMAIRASLPSFWNAGERSDNYNPPLPYVKGTESNSAIITAAVGEATNYMIESNYTVLTADAVPVAEPGPVQYILFVESTKGWPKQGTVNLGGDKYRYELKSANTIIINEYLSGQPKRLYKAGTKINYDHMEWSEIQNLYKRQNFKSIRPGFEISDFNWEEAFRRVYRGAHNTQATLFQYMFWLFRSFNIRFLATVDATGARLNIAPPATIQAFYDALPFDLPESMKYNFPEGVGLNRSHERRPIIISKTPIFDINPDEVYFTNGLQKQAGFFLEPNDTSYWRGAFEHLVLNEDGRPIDADGNILRDVDARVENANDLREKRLQRVDDDGQPIIYYCEIMPWFWSEDWNGRFELEIDDSILTVMTGFIDQNFIDFDIFLDSILEGATGVVSDLGINDLLSSGIIGRIIKRRRGGTFGTHILPEQNPALVELDIDNNFILEDEQ